MHYFYLLISLYYLSFVKSEEDNDKKPLLWPLPHKLSYGEQNSLMKISNKNFTFKFNEEFT